MNEDNPCQMPARFSPLLPSKDCQYQSLNKKTYQISKESEILISYLILKREKGHSFYEVIITLIPIFSKETCPVMHGLGCKILPN